MEIVPETLAKINLNWYSITRTESTSWILLINENSQSNFHSFCYLSVVIGVQ